MGLCEGHRRPGCGGGGHWTSRRRAPVRTLCWDCRWQKEGSGTGHRGHLRNRGRNSQVLSRSPETGVGCLEVPIARPVPWEAAVSSAIWKPEKVSDAHSQTHKKVMPLHRSISNPISFQTQPVIPMGNCIMLVDSNLPQRQCCESSLAFPKHEGKGLTAPHLAVGPWQAQSCEHGRHSLT